MSNKLYEENDIQNIANAIRNKNGREDTYKVSQMSNAIDSIEVIESATAEGESLSLTNTKAMPYSDYVVKGKSEQDGEPSPSNPSEIHSVADDVNLFDENGGITLHSTYSSTGSIISLNSSFVQETYIKVEPNTAYTLSSTNDYSSLDPGEYRLIICEYDSSKTFIQRNIGTTEIHNKYTIITTSNTQYVRLCATTLTIDELKFQKGSVATPYSPYNQGTVTIKQRGTTESNDYTFQTEPLRSLPNGVKDSKDTKQHTRVGVKVFDGSENNWNIETTANYTRFYIKIDNAVINTTERQMILSNYFKYGTGNLVGTAFIYNQYLFIYPNTDILTIEELKTWLSTHNTEFIYELKEEIIEPLTQNQATTMLDIIKTGSYEGTTNIYTDEDVKPTIKADYYKKK